MSIQEIEKAIAKLHPKELMTFRTWFHNFDDLAWEKQFEQDVKMGKLDRLADKAKDDFKNGHCRER